MTWKLLQRCHHDLSQLGGQVCAVFLAWTSVRPRRVGVGAAAASTDVIRCTCQSAFLCQTDSALVLLGNQTTKRSVGGVPNTAASVSRLAMSDTDVFPGRPCVDGGSVSSGGFSDDLRICRNIWPLWMADSNGSTLPSASSGSFAIDVLDGCMVKGGGGVQGHFRTFRWLKALWSGRL